jgi:predicted CXXCH cytochrome family protein
MTPLRSALFVLLVAAISPSVSSAQGSLAPLPAKPAPVSSHAPYEAGECRICHQSGDPRRPGALNKATPALCLDCHEEFVGVLKRPHTHAPARAACTSCHNPHNARHPKLLLDEPRVLCTNCHANIKAISEDAKVKHGALSTRAQCANCHNPHGSSVERLLIALPFDLCVTCHNRDGMVGADGKKLQNMKAWLEANAVWHGPVIAKDCTACHQPHGSGNFRLLREAYPPEFYAPYDARNYALCFSCHSEAAFSTSETTTLTNFRNGARNLHYVHLHQGNRGRTCRACHEVHASKQEHHIREGVPYGSGGWVLKLHYKRTETGGSCEKTCHQERSYSNRGSR